MPSASRSVSYLGVAYLTNVSGVALDCKLHVNMLQLAKVWG